jgi:hypothetical protein
VAEAGPRGWVTEDSDNDDGDNQNLLTLSACGHCSCYIVSKLSFSSQLRVVDSAVLPSAPLFLKSFLLFPLKMRKLRCRENIFTLNLKNQGRVMQEEFF